MKRFIGAIILSLSVVPVMICIGLLMFYLFDEGYLFPGIERYSDQWNTVHATISMTPAVIIGCIYWLSIWSPLVHWTRSRLVLTLLLAGAALTVAMNLIFADIEYSDMADKITWANILFAVIFILGSIPIWKRTQADFLARLDDAGSCPRLEAIMLCPACQSDMTNLSELICPGCEKHYTINELLSANVLESTGPEPQNTEPQTDSQEAGQ